MHKTRKSNNNWAKKSDCMGKKETLLDQQKKYVTLHKVTAITKINTRTFLIIASGSSSLYVKITSFGISQFFPTHIFQHLK